MVGGKVRVSGGQVARWTGGQVMKRSGDPTGGSVVGWVDGSKLRRSGGQVIRWVLR